MEISNAPQNSIDKTKREFGLTLPDNAPRMGIGWRVLIDESPYFVESAQDFESESIIRRYVVSITEAEWIKRVQSETVRDDVWPIGTPNSNLAGVFGGIALDQINDLVPLLTDGAPGDQLTGQTYLADNSGVEYYLRLAFQKAQQISVVRLVFSGTDNYSVEFWGIPRDGTYPAQAVNVGVYQNNSNGTNGTQDVQIPFPDNGREWMQIIVRLAFEDDGGDSIFDVRAYDPRMAVID